MYHVYFTLYQPTVLSADAWSICWLTLLLVDTCQMHGWYIGLQSVKCQSIIGQMWKDYECRSLFDRHLTNIHIGWHIESHTQPILNQHSMTVNWPFVSQHLANTTWLILSQHINWLSIDILANNIDQHHSKHDQNWSRWNLGETRQALKE